MKKVLKGLFIIAFLFCALFLYRLFFDYKKNKLENNDNNSNIILNKADLENILIKSNIEIPIYEYLIPQGLTIVDDKIFISVYDNMGLKNSKVYVIDKDGNVINVTTLDNNSHVGALAYDKINRLIWIPDNDGALNAYNVKDFYSKSHTFYKYHFGNVAKGLVDYQDKKKKSIDYLTIKDDVIYIGNFSLNNKGLVKSYKIKKDITLEYLSEFKVPDKVQGMAFYDKYMFLSTSYGRKKQSNMLVYKYEEDIKDYNKLEVINYELPSMLEQITVYNHNIYLIFENTAKKYADSIDKIGHICIIDASKIIKDLG